MSVQEHQKINSAVQPTTVKSEYASADQKEKKGSDPRHDFKPAVILDLAS